MIRRRADRPLAWLPAGGEGVALGLVLLAGCFAAPVEPYPALRLPASTLREHVRVICLSKPSVPDGIPDADARAETIEYAVTNALTPAGFTAVGSARTAALGDQIVSQEGGTFDPYTGLRDEQRYRRVHERVMAEARASLGCDAFLTTGVVVVVAPVEGGRARWDGAEEAIAGGEGSYGWVRALTVISSLSDAQGTEIYFGTGGLQVLAQMQSAFLSTNSVAVPVSELLSHPQIVSRGVYRSLEDLVNPLD